MTRTIEVDLFPPDIEKRASTHSNYPHHRRHRETTVTVPLAPADPSPPALETTVEVDLPPNEHLQATVETVFTPPTSPLFRTRHSTVARTASRPATLVPGDHHPVTIEVNINAPQPTPLTGVPTTPLPAQVSVVEGIHQPLNGEKMVGDQAAHMHLAEYESIRGGTVIGDHTTHDAPHSATQHLSVPEIEVGGVKVDMAGINIPRLPPATPGMHGGGKHRRSLHATVTIPMQPAQPPHPPQPSQVSEAPPPRLASPAHIGRAPAANEVDVDIEPNHVTVHTHKTATPPSKRETVQTVRPSRRSPTVVYNHDRPQTVVEIYPQAHTGPPPHLSLPRTTAAPTNVSIAPTHSVRTSPPRSVGPPQVIPPPHHTHRFPHSASTTSESAPREPHIHTISHLPGEVVHVEIGPEETVNAQPSRVVYTAPVPRNFSEIKPIPIIDYHSFLRSPPLYSNNGQQVHPLREVPNPAPAPVILQDDQAQPQHPHSMAQEDPPVDPDYFHRNLKKIPVTRAGAHPMTAISKGNPSRINTQAHGNASETGNTRNERRHRSHHRKNSHHHRHGSPDRHSEHRSELTSYRKIEPVSGPEDKVGEYALPPDYNARLEKERIQKEKEAEQMEAKMKARFPGMIPGAVGMGLGPWARPPLGLLPGMRPPMVLPGMMGMMRPPILPMGMPFGPGMMPGHGMMGAFNPNAMPGRFGRDVLGRDFAGPGGLGHSRPYRPPDPSILGPMPQGLPFVARPLKEGFDAYGRPIPPPAPEGFDGWGRPIPGPDGKFPLMQPPGMLYPGMPQHPGAQGQMNVSQTPPLRDSSSDTSPSSSPDSGRPEEPPMFHRAPSTENHYQYGDFESFAFPASRLFRPGRLRRPPALKDHDVRQDEWGYFIEALSQEALRHVDSSLDVHSGHTEPEPRLTKAVQDLLRAWQHGYFGPRAVQVYIARNGKKVYDHGYGVPRHRAALSMRDGRSIYTDDRETYSDGASTDDSDFDPHEEARFSARERAYRREKRRRRATERKELRHGDIRGEWEVHFAYTEPTMFKPGVKPRRYGERVPFERPKY